MSEKRKYPRTPMKVRVKVKHDSVGEIIVATRDISDGGIFLLTSDHDMPPIGTIVEGQVIDLPEEGPIIKLEIVRVEPMGVGLKYKSV